MTEDSHSVCLSLINWLNTINDDHQCINLSDLIDGRAISQCLYKIAPQHFSLEWLSVLDFTDENSRVAQAANLRRIIDRVNEYYFEALGLHFEQYEHIDETKIVEIEDEEQIIRLLQLVLGCAIKSPQREDHIKIIMGLDDATQAHVGNVLQELIARESVEGGLESDRHVKEAWDEIQLLTHANEALSQKCHELETLIATLQEEKEALSRSISLNSDVPNNFSTEEMTTFGNKYRQIQDQLEEMSHENYRLEAMKEELRSKCDSQAKEMFDLQERVAELSNLADQARLLKDEVDIHKINSENVVKLEAQVESFKKKLQDMSDLRRQLKLVEDKNSLYMQNNLHLEEEVKKTHTLRQQVESYRVKLQTQELQLSEETRRADKAEFELKRVSEKCAQTERELKKSLMDCAALREEQEEMEHKNSLGVDTDCRQSMISPMLDVHPDIRERLTRLTFENKQMASQLEQSSHTELELVKTQLADEQRRKSEIETENRLSHQKILELESSLTDTQQLLDRANQSESSAEQLIEMRKRLHGYMDKLKLSESESDRLKAQISQHESKSAEYEKKVETLNKRLSHKENDMQLMETRYKEYLSKAKTVFDNLDPRNSACSNEVKALKASLYEKTKMIEQLEREREKTKACRDTEEKLIVSAWNNLSMQLHRKACDERLASQQSYLNRHRQAGLSHRRIQQCPPRFTQVPEDQQQQQWANNGFVHGPAYEICQQPQLQVGPDQIGYMLQATEAPAAYQCYLQSVSNDAGPVSQHVRPIELPSIPLHPWLTEASSGCPTPDPNQMVNSPSCHTPVMTNEVVPMYGHQTVPEESNHVSNRQPQRRPSKRGNSNTNPDLKVR